MARKTELDSEYARSAARGTIPSLLGDASEQVLRALLENPHLDETHLCLLLEREDLPQTILERIARRRQWLSHYPVKRRVAFHPHTPRLVAMRLARELFLMDLVQLSLFPSVPAELRRLAEERSEEHTSELQSLAYLVCRLLLEKKKNSNRRWPCFIKVAYANRAIVPTRASNDE